MVSPSPRQSQDNESTLILPFLLIFAMITPSIIPLPHLSTIELHPYLITRPPIEFPQLTGHIIGLPCLSTSLLVALALVCLLQDRNSESET